MRVTFDRSDDVLVLRAEGALEPQTAPVLHGAMAKALAEQPQALVCDLTALQVAAPRHLAMLIVLSDLASDWPGVSIVVACSHDLAEKILRLGLDRLVVVVTSLDVALREAHRHALPRRVRLLRLGTVDRKARVARDFVADVCASWGVPGAADNARQLVNELVAHALRNGLEPTEVQLALQPRSVYLLVRSRPPHWSGQEDDTSDRPLAPRLDLSLIDTLARGWGGRPTSDGGEILWCLVDHASRPSD